MDEKYDAIVLGTGLTECVLSGLLSVEGKKVLHMDRKDYYGGECASLNLTQLLQKFNKTLPKDIGRGRDFNIDLIPKFMMANEELVKVLVYTDVTRYLEFKQISCSMVYREGRLYKVPATEFEAIKTPLAGIFEKRRLKNFLEFIQSWRDDDPKTHQGIDLDKDTMATLYAKYNLSGGVQEYIGHAMCLYLDDSYKNKPIRESYNRILLYVSSLGKYGKSPYIYPLYGLGELPQGFARLSAIYGGTYMLDVPVDGIELNEDGKFKGVRSGDNVVEADIVIGDPSYFQERTEVVAKVVRAFCLLKHPIDGLEGESGQIIIPQQQVGREHDIYITCLSFEHNVVAKGTYLASVSTIVETSTPELEIHPALNLLGDIVEKFVTISDISVPKEDGTSDNVFVSKSYDATSHFVSVFDDIKDIYKRVTGNELVVKQRANQDQQE
ncbi:Rab GDP dissociation inhibitor alpha [Mycoemilia scoparia]|uniref:Rab GDP dissociation inhibitor n=1 Tax=Mycoemilia scoparia TaxID=417184 RepID=A0A9W8DQF6_9FUNG|nr:Rab GDP dissociation inhibitor alpha [Mycoemilia scoparia]